MKYKKLLYNVYYFCYVANVISYLQGTCIIFASYVISYLQGTCIIFILFLLSFAFTFQLIVLLC